MNKNELAQERLGLLKNAITGKQKNYRIPHRANLWSWKFLDAGYTVTQALYDYDALEKVMRHCAETYPFDMLAETGWRNPIAVTSVLGNDEYIINDKTSSISLKDQCFFSEDDYKALIENPAKYLWEEFAPKKYKLLQKDENSEELKAFMAKRTEFMSFIGEINKMLVLEYGVPAPVDLTSPFDQWGNGFELLFCSIRGIKGLSMDVRRRPNEVADAIEALNNLFVYPRYNAANKTVGTSKTAAFDTLLVMLGQTILSPKQFERFYWPYLKSVFNYIDEYEKIGYIFAEGENARFYDFFNDVKPGTFGICSEMNDVFEMKEKIPNMSIAGGMSVELLGQATPQECVDFAKKLIDELAYDGKYIFSQNKMISFPYDCKSENLKAVSDFVYTYRV